MLRRSFVLVVPVVLAAAPGLQAAPPSPGAPAPALVPAADARVATMGRLARLPNGALRIGYPGVTLRLRFEGPSLALRLSAEGPNIHLALMLDEGEPRTVRLPPGESELRLADGLPGGPHVVDVVHRTETWQGILTVQGVVTGPGSRLLPAQPWPRRRLMFVGDSVTCGSSIDRENAADGSAPSNGYLSYGMLLGRKLDAQVHLVCYGGRGVIRDWRGRSDVLTAPQFFELAVPEEQGAPAWDHAEYAPDLVFVSLGTNDFNLALGPLPQREPFVAAYVGFVQTIRRRHPGAEIVLTEGAIVNDDDPRRPKTMLREYLAETARRLADPHVHVVPSEHYPGDARDAHPTRDGHRAMARDFEPVLRTILGW